MERDAQDSDIDDEATAGQPDDRERERERIIRALNVALARDLAMLFEEDLAA